MESLTSLVADQAPEYMKPKQAAAYLGLSVQQLELWRWRAEGPPYLRVTSRIIRYRRADLDAWMSAFERRSVAAAG